MGLDALDEGGEGCADFGEVGSRSASSELVLTIMGMALRSGSASRAAKTVRPSRVGRMRSRMISVRFPRGWVRRPARWMKRCLSVCGV
jgi:hypothetical protein